MVHLNIRKALLIAALISGVQAMGQQKTDSVYDAVAAFVSLPHPPGNLQRSAAGTPGAGYWQNKAAYTVAVTLDTLTRGVKGEATIVYTNNSPDTLTYIWLISVQNRFRADSRESLLTPPQGSRFGTSEHTEGTLIGHLHADGQPATYRVTDKFIRVALTKPLMPGKQTRLEIGYQFTLPVSGSDFMGLLKTPYGSVYQYTGVFPRVCIYDDQRGWNVFSAQYYVEAGSIDMQITAPANMIVQGTGILTNPEAVLQPVILKRYRQALQSDSVMRVRTVGERITPDGKAMLTWRFREPNAGDGIWAVSAAFNWDVARTQLPGNLSVPTMALYPPGSHAMWDTITTAMQKIIKQYSNQWSSYPYNSAVNIGGSITGVAGPGVSVLHYANSSMGSTIWTKTNHEIGHAWFNLMIAADSRYGWMCEGQNVFINLLNADTLQGSAPFEMADGLAFLANRIKRVPVQTAAGSIPPDLYGFIMYLKPAVALMLLRNEVLGPERFDDAFRQYIKAWSFKHPAPGDFFRTMESASGEELSWFWRAWFLTDARLDQGIQQVEYFQKDPAKGLLITLVNKQMMPMPVTLLVHEFNGKKHRVKLPVQIWEWNGRHQLKVPATSPVVSVLLDPDQALPDEDRSNNTWIGGGAKMRTNRELTARQVVDRYLEAIGGKEKVTQLQTTTWEYKAGPNGAFVIRQKYSPGGSFSWTSDLESGSVYASLKNLQLKDSLHFINMGQQFPLSTVEEDELRHTAALFPELRFFEAGNTVVLSDSLQFIHGIDVFIVTVTTPAGNAWKFYYDVATGLKVREEYAGPGKPLLYASKVLAEYDIVNGIRIPRQVILNEDGTKDEMYELKNFIKS